MEYKKKAHSVYLMTYHLVFVTKYRKPVISNEIGEFMKELSREICEQHGGTLISAETNTDHMHLFISMPPQRYVTKKILFYIFVKLLIEMYFL